MKKEELNLVIKELKKVLRMRKSKHTQNIVQRMIKNTQADLKTTIPKLKELRKVIKDLKGNVTYSKSGNYVKIAQRQEATTKESLEFYRIIKKWEEDSKIELYYYPLRNTFYIK